MYTRPAQPVAPATNIKYIQILISFHFEYIIPFRRAWPIAGLCCFGLIGFLIATTIVLALIPLYIPNKQVTVNNIRKLT